MTATLFPDLYPCTCDRPGRLGCERCGPQPREQPTSCLTCQRLTWATDGRCDTCYAAAHPLRLALSAEWDDETFEHRDHTLLIFCRPECRALYRRLAAPELVLVDCTTTRGEGVDRFGNVSDFGPFCSTCGGGL